jgi:predicted Mrr-cat superfamily restriction endonuclease
MTRLVDEPVSVNAPHVSWKSPDRVEARTRIASGISSTQSVTDLRTDQSATWKLHCIDGRNGFLLNQWIDLSLVTIGFCESDPVAHLSRRELLDLFAAQGDPRAATQIATFRDTVARGDVVVVPARRLQTCAIGVVIGPYGWCNRPIVLDHHHFRPVRWLEDLDWDELPSSAKPSLSDSWTLSRIDGPAAAWFVRRAIAADRSRSSSA